MAKPTRPNTLVVPIHLDALVLRGDKPVIEPMADFSRLPHTVDGHDKHPDVAYLSEELLSQPFHDRGFTLRAGIHLHWALPDALHRGSGHGLLFSLPADRTLRDTLGSNELSGALKAAFAANGHRLSGRVSVITGELAGRWIIDDRGNGRRYTLRVADRWQLATDDDAAVVREARLNVYGSAVSFPAVPDRWLVMRQGEKVASRQWIVESDYLHPPGTTPAKPLVTYPYEEDSSPVPFRYLGRTLRRDQWESLRHESVSRIDRLTAIGYGEPNFAAFYPNCHSVFGFHDDELAGAPANEHGDVIYDVLGWYSRPEQDCLRSDVLADTVDGLMRRYGLDQPGAGVDARGFTDLVYEAIGSHLAWQPDMSPPEAIVERTVCHARVTLVCDKNFDYTDPAGDRALRHKVDVAIGNTGTEALSAYLAHRLKGADPKQKRDLEDQLEAVHLINEMDAHQIDIGAKFREARHAKEFTAIAGGTHWSAVAKEIRHTDDGRPLVPEPLTPPILATLADLNRLQAEQDRDQRELAALRRQLFADWCRYQVRAYPSLGDEIDIGPHLQQVQAFIVQHDLKPIEQRIAVGEKRSMELRETLAALLERVESFNQEHPEAAGYEVKTGPAPQFWQPNEPVVMIAGDAALATPRHGTDGLLSCKPIALPDGPLEDHVDALVDLAEGLGNGEGGDPDRHKRGEQPWHPFLLEWSAHIHPLKSESNVHNAERRYRSSFVDANYTEEEADVDLFLREPLRASFADSANVVSGRTILTPYASDQLRLQLEATLRRRLAPGYRDATKTQRALDADDEPEIAFKTLHDWYRGAEASYRNAVSDALLDAYDGFYDAKGEVSIPCLTQSLGGFNEALLMRKQTLQLPVSDPLGFVDDRAFAARVAAGVGNMNRSAPQPNTHFMPIRAGLLHLSRLRLVDTFGRTQQLDFEPEQVITTNAMTVGETDLTQLRPRLTQPARVNLRWLAAASNAASPQGERETTRQSDASPICGWLMPNHLDSSLMIYSATGQALGSIEYDRGSAQWRGTPSEERLAPEQLPNAHLCRLVCHLIDSDFGGFLARLEDQMEHIDPQWFAQHEALSVLIGRPLALVRARLGLEIHGLPALNQRDEAFTNDVYAGNAAKRTHDGFTAVKFPIRLGDARQLNDGLAVYWQENRDDEGGCRLQSEAQFSDRAKPITLSLDDAPVTFTLLLDPRGLLHARSGILPTKAINIPQEHYADTLKRLDITFRTGPVLGNLDKLALPLPEEPGYAWSWLERVDDEWQSIDDVAALQTDARWDGTPEILEGWLKLTESVREPHDNEPSN